MYSIQIANARLPGLLSCADFVALRGTLRAATLAQNPHNRPKTIPQTKLSTRTGCFYTHTNQPLLNLFHTLLTQFTRATRATPRTTPCSDPLSIIHMLFNDT
jgi:hypothetical protein